MMESLEHRIRDLGQWTIESNPRTERVLLHARALYAITHLRWVASMQARAHPAGVDPFRVDRVDPDDIQYTAEQFDAVPKFRRIGRIYGGDWDRSTERFTDRTIYRSFEAHFEDGVPWAETEFYGEIRSRIEAGETLWECATPAEFDQRCADLDALYETIARDGVRSQAELAADPGDDPVAKERPARIRGIEDDIAVHVGRNGDLLFADGRNRLAIAKLLDVDTIPVRIVVRHERWQAFRDAVAEGRVDPGTYAEHPDIRAILENE